MAGTTPESPRSPLPRGPHKLPRSEIVASQRRRLLRATAEAMADRGYANTSVSDILRRAHVSRETFYEQFASKQECFIAAYEAAAELILADVDRAAGRPGTILERFDRTVGVYLEALAAEPAFARLFMVEVYSAGTAAIERRARIQQRFTDRVIEAFGAQSDGERFACEALVAAVITLVTGRLAEGDSASLPALRAPLCGLVRAAWESRGLADTVARS